MAFAYSLSLEHIAFVKVEAMTGDAADAQSTSAHALVIVLKDGTKYEAELLGDKVQNQPYEIELSTDSFQPKLITTKAKIKEVYVKAGGNDGWEIASIDTYTDTTKKPYTILTADPHFNKWVDGNDENLYPYDAKWIALTEPKGNKHQSNVYSGQGFLTPGKIMRVRKEIGNSCLTLENVQAKNWELLFWKNVGNFNTNSTFPKFMFMEHCFLPLGKLLSPHWSNCLAFFAQILFFSLEYCK